MKKLLCVISISLVAFVYIFAKSITDIDISRTSYICPYCKVKLVHKYIEVGRDKCGQCDGRGWYGTHDTKQESREKGIICDPCNYCKGKRTIPIMGYRWVCPKCKTKFRVD
ncbi:hypothetical protein [Prevotella sp. HCN-7019]|uniref:hypothetical protein n=1 Tax=Prevotella sp. HCN-7019 TaxID=3134668 RepID=UPI0030BD9E8E